LGAVGEEWERRKEERGLGGDGENLDARLLVLGARSIA
jgi:hypothetical protein